MKWVLCKHNGKNKMSDAGYVKNPSKYFVAFAAEGASLESTKEKITATFALVVNSSNQLLVLKNERGWDIPGGHLNKNESVLDATHREVLEESCVTLRNTQFYALIKNGDSAMSVFTAEPEQIQPFVLNSEDPTSDRTFMTIKDFKQVYSGGDTAVMFELLDKLPVKDR